MIAGYLGNSDVFDDAIGRFALDYANQTERDYKTLARAVRDKRLTSVEASLRLRRWTPQSSFEQRTA